MRTVRWRTMQGKDTVRLLLSCAEQMLGDRPLDQKLAAIREAGFDGVDVRWSTLADPAARATLAAADLPVGAVYSQLRDPGLLSRTAAARARALDALVERAMVAASVGARNLIVVPIFGPPHLPDFAPIATVASVETALLLAALNEIADRIADVPIVLAIEPLNAAETHLLTDPTTAATICTAIGSPRIATMVDTYHCARNGQDSAAQIAAVGDHLALVHLSDTDRRLPGEGAVDFRSPLAALRRCGYDGWLGFECRPGSTAEDLARSVRHIRALSAAG